MLLFRFRKIVTPLLIILIHTQQFDTIHVHTGLQSRTAQEYSMFQLQWWEAGILKTSPCYSRLFFVLSYTVVIVTVIVCALLNNATAVSVTSPRRKKVRMSVQLCTGL